MVANGQLEKPKSTVELKFQVDHIELHEIFIVMEKITSPLNGFSYLHRINAILGMRQGMPIFLIFSCNQKLHNTFIPTLWNLYASGRMSKTQSLSDNSSYYIHNSTVTVLSLVYLNLGMSLLRTAV